MYLDRGHDLVIRGTTEPSRGHEIKQKDFTCPLHASVENNNY